MIGGKQSEVDSLNVLGNQMMQSNDEHIRDLVRKHLEGLNENWNRVKEKVLSDQPLFIPMKKDGGHTEMDERDKDESLYRRIQVRNMQQGEDMPDGHLQYQILFSDVFDWLVLCEENMRAQAPSKYHLDKFEKLSARYLVRSAFYQYFLFTDASLSRQRKWKWKLVY